MIEIGKLQTMLWAIERQRGPFDLAMIVYRDDLPDTWDLLLSAKWLKDENLTDVKFITNEVEKAIGKKSIERLGTIAILDYGDYVKSLLSEIDGKSGERTLPQSMIRGHVLIPKDGVWFIEKTTSMAVRTFEKSLQSQLIKARSQLGSLEWAISNNPVDKREEAKEKFKQAQENLKELMRLDSEYRKMKFSNISENVKWVLAHPLK